MNAEHQQEQKEARQELRKKGNGTNKCRKGHIGLMEKCVLPCGGKLNKIKRSERAKVNVQNTQINDRIDTIMTNIPNEVWLTLGWEINDINKRRAGILYSQMTERWINIMQVFIESPEEKKYLQNI